MTYIMGFVSPVPAENKEAYRKFAEDYVDMFRSFGATRLMEAWGDDLPEGEATDFRKAVAAEAGEVVVFSWQEFPDKAAADRASEAMQSAPEMEQMGERMPFDARRMIYGGFEGISEHGRVGRPGYVEGSAIPVPSERKAEYIALIEKQASLFTELGATRFLDAWGDNVPDGERTDFRRAVKAEPGETVVLSFIEWPSKAVRDAGWPKAMEDPRMHEAGPGDESRRIFGGFLPLLDV